MNYEEYRRQDAIELAELAARGEVSAAEQLAPGSAIAFDYPARHIIQGNASLAYRLTKIAARLIGEPCTFGVSTEAPAKESLAAYLKQNGLRLEEHEPAGDVECGD